MRLNLHNNRNAVRKTFLTVGTCSSCSTNWRFCIKEEKEGERSPMKNSDESLEKNQCGMEISIICGMELVWIFPGI